MTSNINRGISIPIVQKAFKVKTSLGKYIKVKGPYSVFYFYVNVNKYSQTQSKTTNSVLELSFTG